MSEIMRLPLSLVDGFYPATANTGPNSTKTAVKDGRNVLWLGPGLMRSSRGLLGVGPPGIGAARLYIVNDQIASVNGTGSILEYRSALYYLTEESGAGIINVGGINYNGTGGKLRYYIRATAKELNAGLTAPTTAPTLGPGTTGTYISASTSVKITRIRTTKFVDGAEVEKVVFEESNPGPASNIVAVENKKILFTNWPAKGTGFDEHDSWGLYTTEANGGSLGGYQLFRIIADTDISGGQIEIDLNDTDRKSIFPPTANLPPPTGSFCCNIGNVIFVLGTRGGTHYAPSTAGFPGAYNPLAEANMPVPEKPVGVLMRPQEAEVYAWSKNGLQSFALSANPEEPIYSRAIWTQVGIPSPNGACWAGRRFVCFISEGPAMIGADGQPDTGFAQPVRAYLMDMGIDPSKVSVGYDPVADAVVFGLGGDLALVYHMGLSELLGKPIWSVPIELNFNVGASTTAFLTFQNQLVIARGQGLSYWENGTMGGTRNWYLDTARQDGPNPMDFKTLMGYRLHTDFPVQADLFIDDAALSGSPEFSLVDLVTGDHYTSWNDCLLNVQCINYALRIKGSKSGQRLDDIQFAATYEPGSRAS